jgi:hypothetical protein
MPPARKQVTTSFSDPQVAGRTSLGGVVPLVFLILILTLGVVGYSVSTLQKPVRPEVYSAACEASVQSAVLDGSREIARACSSQAPAAAQKVTTVPAREGAIGFDYPEAWSARLIIDASSPTPWTAELVPGPFVQAEGTEGQRLDIRLQQGTLTAPNIQAQPTFLAYLQSLYSAELGYSQIAIDSVSEGTAMRYKITGTVNLFEPLLFEAIYYTANQSWANAVFIDTDSTSTSTNDAWEIIKTSLDFSGIK